MHSHHNGLKTTILLSVMFGLLLLIGQGISIGTGQSSFTYIFAGIGLVSIFFSYWNSAKLALKSMNAYPVTKQEQPAMYAIVEELSAKAGKPMPKLYVAPTMSPNAFATGRNPENAAVCCTEGILSILDERELRGVLAHELMHVYNRDILTSSIAAGIGSFISTIAHFGMYSAGRSRQNKNQGANIITGLITVLLAPIAATALRFAISRTREFDADEDGARLSEDPLALASALKKLESGIAHSPIPVNQRTENVSHMMIANPFGGLNMKRLFSTHPPTAERVKRLEKMAGY